MSKYRDLVILFHAWGLESYFQNTKTCKLVKSFMEQSVEREELLYKIPPPRDLFWNQSKKEIEDSEDMGIRHICILDEDYPKLLQEIDDPPLVLFLMGKGSAFDILKKTSYSIVGTRKATPYGITTAKQISNSLVEEGFIVVSGLAHGIDTAAHRGALSKNASTIAVLGSGLLDIFPKLNIELAEEIIDKEGLIISEYGLRAKSQSYMFPRRNRIVTGLSKGTIVVEAELRSGSLISARLSLEQNRDVFSVPGLITDSTSNGTNKLISEGAQIIYSVESFMDTVSPKENNKTRGGLENQIEIIKVILTSEEEKLINKMEDGFFTFEELIYITGYSSATLRQMIGVLILKDVIKEVDGTYGR